MRNLRCRYVHLTNYSVNKKSKRYVEADGDDGPRILTFCEAVPKCRSVII